MQAFEVRAGLAAGLLLLAVVSGVVTTSLGRPLNMVVSTVHKLLALAAIVFAVLLALDVLKATGNGALAIAVTVSAGALLLALLATGAVLSTDKLATVPLRAVHAAIPVAAAFGVALLGYLRLRLGL